MGNGDDQRERGYALQAVLRFGSEEFCSAAGEEARTRGRWSWVGDGDSALDFARWLMGRVNVTAWSFAVMFLHLPPCMKEIAMTNKSFTIWRAILIAGMVIGLAGLVGEMVWSADKGKLKEMEVISMTTSAKIAIEGAVETALGTVAGQVIGAELEKRGDKTVWNVKILSTEEAIMAVYIDAVSGSVLMTEVKVAERRPVQESTL